MITHHRLDAVRDLLDSIDIVAGRFPAGRDGIGVMPIGGMRLLDDLESPPGESSAVQAVRPRTADLIDAEGGAHYWRWPTDLDLGGTEPATR